MENIVYIDTGPNTIKATVSELNKRAKRGDFVSLAVIGITKDNQIVQGVVVGERVFTLLGAVEHVKFCVEAEIE